MAALQGLDLGEKQARAGGPPLEPEGTWVWDWVWVGPAL